jgi:cell division septum initiation protein DivIVA
LHGQVQEFLDHLRVDGTQLRVELADVVVRAAQLQERLAAFDVPDLDRNVVGLEVRF